MDMSTWAYGQVENADFSDIANIENTDVWKPRIFEISVFDIH